MTMLVSVAEGTSDRATVDISVVVCTSCDSEVVERSTREPRSSTIVRSGVLGESSA